MTLRIYFSLFLFITTTIGFSQVEKHSSIPLKHGAHRKGKRTDAAMEHWRDYGFGQFIHWGLYSILGGDYNGQHYPGASEWIRSWDQLPNDEYDKLNKKFNPEQWAEMANSLPFFQIEIKIYLPIRLGWVWRACYSKYCLL